MTSESALNEKQVSLLKTVQSFSQTCYGMMPKELVLPTSEEDITVVFAQGLVAYTTVTKHSKEVQGMVLTDKGVKALQDLVQ